TISARCGCRYGSTRSEANKIHREPPWRRSHLGGSVRVATDDLAAIAAAERVVDDVVDTLLEEVDRAIGEEEAGPAGVPAHEPLGGGAEAAVQRSRGLLKLVATVRQGGIAALGVPAQRDGRARDRPRRGPEVVIAIGARQDLADQDGVAGAVGHAGDPG